jgi:hypothetical protein
MKNKYLSVNNNVFFIFLFQIILLELFLLGSGRLLEIGSVTGRMVLFTISIITSIAIVILIKKIEKNIFILIVIFSFLLSFATLLGLINNASFHMIKMDLKPLIFFFIILYFGLFIKTQNDIDLIVKLIKFSSLLLTIAYFLFLISMYLGFLDFTQVYTFIHNNSSDIFFRGSYNDNAYFFYKGFLYLNIGFIFYVFSKNKLNKLISLMILIAIILTFTRGFLLALFLSFVLFYFIDLKNKKSLFMMIIIILLAMILSPYIMDIFGNRSESNSIRILQIKQVLESITPISFLIGHGFGIGVPIREMHMEIAYLEIFHKQGMLGVVFWLSILGIIITKYQNIINKNYIVKSFLVSSFFVYAQSATNPFLNNPIGMTIVLLTFVVLSRIRHEEIKYKKGKKSYASKSSNICCNL